MRRRKLIPLLLTFSLLLGILPAGAQAAGSVVALKLGSPLCVIDTQVTQVDESNDQVVPYAVQANGGGYTLLPIRRVLEAHYPAGFDLERYKGYGGILQQYLFYYDLAVKSR